MESYFILNDMVLPCPRHNGIHHLDFFIQVGVNWIPFDLKTTFVSDEYIEDIRESEGLESERNTN